MQMFQSEVGAPEGKAAISPSTAEDINDLFKTLDSEDKPEKPTPVEKKEDIKQGKDDKSDDKDDDDDKEDELELIEPDEDIEKLDLDKKEDDLNIEAPPRKKEILAKFPELFKTFPFLEKMMYRDREMMQLFGSFDDAKELAEKAEVFNNFESQLLEGKTEEILKNVKDVDEKAFNQIVDDYLPTLAKVSREAYLHVTGNLNRRLIMEMVSEANETNNDDLKQAALLVNQFVFGTAKFTAPTNLVEKKNESDIERNEVEKERLELVKERFESSRDELQIQVDNTLRATISDYIDPKNVMSSYVKKNAVNDALKILTESIAKDPTVPKNLDSLWRTAFDTKFSKESLGKIKSFYLGKAKGNLKNAIIKARAEALKDVKASGRPDKEVDDDLDKEDNSRRPTRTITPGRPSQPKKSGMQKGESVADYFARD